MELTSVAEALERSRPLLERHPLLIGCDFDGTLSPLGVEPWSAAILPGAQRALRRLARRPGVDVALISGRAVRDLAARARVGGISYRGDHGAERADAPRGFRPSALAVRYADVSAEQRRIADRLVREVPEAVAEDWLVVERKGIGVTFHWRAAPDLEVARRRVREAADAVDAGRRLVRSGSRRALELRPPDAATKGKTLEGLIAERRPRGVIMIGDDRNDAGAFDVISTARAAGAITGLSVGVAGHPDVVADVARHADLMLADPGAVSRYLSGLGRRR